MKILGIFESQGSVDWGETSVDRLMRGWPIAVQTPKDIAPPTRHFVDTSIACRSLVGTWKTRVGCIFGSPVYNSLSDKSTFGACVKPQRGIL